MTWQARWRGRPRRKVLMLIAGPAVAVAMTAAMIAG